MKGAAELSLEEIVLMIAGLMILLIAGVMLTDFKGVVLQALTGCGSIQNWISDLTAGGIELC